jgi:hypothetical protein
MDFGIISDHYVQHGLFGCTLTWILEILPYLYKNNIYPDFKIHTSSYGDIFPSILTVNEKKAISNTQASLGMLQSKLKYMFDDTDIEFASFLFFHYFSISTDILEYVETTVKRFGNKTLGIHYRGTDKIYGEGSYISKEDVIKNIVAFLESDDTFDTIFVCSDEENFIDMFKEKFLTYPKYKILISDSIKSNDTSKTLHMDAKCNNLLAKQSMSDSLTLSKCNYVIKTTSALSDWVKIWNPNIEIYNLNKFYFDYFPQRIIPVKSYI